MINRCIHRRQISKTSNWRTVDVKYNKTDSLQPSGCNGSLVYIKQIQYDDLEIN